MIRKILLVIVLVFLITGIGFAFQNEPDGFRGLKWGDPPTEDMTFDGQNVDKQDLYYRKSDKLNIGSVELNGITYRFYNKKEFLGVSGDIGSENDFDLLEIFCRERFGKPTRETEPILNDRKGMLEWYGEKSWISLIYFPVPALKIVGCLSITSRADQEEKEEDIAFKQSKQQYDFRKANWGMSKEQVKASEEKKPIFERDNRLAYSVRIGIKGSVCSYNFLENKLYNAGYSFDEGYTNKNAYIDDYKEIKGIQTKKYGKPRFDKITWENDLYKDDPSEWGTAISLGHLWYKAIWETPTTRITLMLTGDNSDVALGILYESKELKEEEEKKPIVLSGTGQEATEKFVLKEGLVRFDFLYTGKHNFVVWLLDNDGREVELLANKIGYFDGSKAIRINKTGIYLLDISADGGWTVTIDMD